MFSKVLESLRSYSDFVWVLGAVVCIAVVEAGPGAYSAAALVFALTLLISALTLATFARRALESRRALSHLSGFGSVIFVLLICLLVCARAQAEDPSLDVVRSKSVEQVRVLLRTDPIGGEMPGYPTTVTAKLDSMLVKLVVSEPILIGRISKMTAGEIAVVSGQLRPIQDRDKDRSRSTHITGEVKVSELESTGQSHFIWQLPNALRGLIQDSARSFDTLHKSLFLGIVIGDDSDQPVWLKSVFRQTGLSHIMAVSGQNIAFVLAVVEPALSRLSVRTRSIVLVSILLLFSMAVRLEPSVLRAVGMQVIQIVAIRIGRPQPPIRVLALTTFVLFLVDPMLGISRGFQLSVLASLGLIVLTRPIKDNLFGPSWLRETLGATLAAQIGTAPLIILMSGGVPLISVLANLIVVPIAGVLMMFGITLGVIGGIEAGLGLTAASSMLMLPAKVLTLLIAKAATWLAPFSFGRIEAIDLIALCLTLPIVVRIVIYITNHLLEVFRRGASSIRTMTSRGSGPSQTLTRQESGRTQTMTRRSAGPSRTMVRQAFAPTNSNGLAGDWAVPVSVLLSLLLILNVVNLTLRLWDVDESNSNTTRNQVVTRVGGKTIAFIEPQASKSQVIRQLERTGIKHIDLLVVRTNSSRPALVAAEVVRAIGVSAVVVPKGRYLHEMPRAQLYRLDVDSRLSLGAIRIEAQQDGGKAQLIMQS